MTEKKFFEKTKKSAQKIFDNISENTKEIYEKHFTPEKLKKSLDKEKIVENVKSEFHHFKSDIADFSQMVHEKYLKDITFEKTASEIDKLDHKISTEIENFYDKIKKQ